MSARTRPGHQPRHHAADNVLHFVRVLRAAGLPLGSDRALLAIAAIEAVGVARRDDLRAALSSILVNRADQRALFDAAFEAFWRDPKLLERIMLMMLPKVRGKAEPPGRGARLQEALNPDRRPPAAAAQPDQQDETRIDALLTWSDREQLQKADFATMTVDEFRIACRMAQDLTLPLRPVRSRRREPARRGRADLRLTARQGLRTPDLLLPRYVTARILTPPLVILLDISGSMERYSRMFLVFAHALSQRQTVHTLVFGTRLTSISHCLRHRDPDEALAQADRLVEDWRGGTRIAANLHRFNRDWARRVLNRNATLLLVTDGLERDESGTLGIEAARLGRFAREFIWLNPLLRFEGFEPKAAGIRAILPHVDRFLPMHNLSSLADLARALQVPPSAQRPAYPDRMARPAGPPERIARASDPPFARTPTP